MSDVRARGRGLAIGALVALLLSGSARCLAAKETGAKHFPTPQAAAEALLGAVAREDAATAMAVLGPDGREIVFSGDPAADRPTRKAFLEAAQQKTVFLSVSKNVVVLEVGPDEWPLPIPIVKGPKGWSFDTAAGKEELLSRRIGRNELRTIALCRGFVKVQQEYARTSDAGKAGPYAQKLLSTDGTHDGLYWPAKAGEPQSPLGPLADEAARDGYQPPASAGGGQRPFHGYLFKVLTAQGASAPGGARSYVVDGKMTGGFALVAWPVDYRVSGVMTFLVNQNGIVFQKDLGPKTSELAPSIENYDPGAGWTPTKL
jgi:hypothetical protein